jgi:hypothetical protein
MLPVNEFDLEKMNFKARSKNEKIFFASCQAL